MPLPTKFKALMKKKIGPVPLPIAVAGAGAVAVIAYRRYAGGGGGSSADGSGAGLPGGGGGGSASDYSGGSVGGGGGYSEGSSESGGDYTVGPGGAFLPQTAGIAGTPMVVKNITRIIKRQRIRIGKKVVYQRKGKRGRRVAVATRIVINQPGVKAAAKRRNGPHGGHEGGRPIAGGRNRPNSPPIIRPSSRAKAARLPRRRRGQSPPIVRTGK